MLAEFLPYWTNIHELQRLLLIDVSMTHSYVNMNHFMLLIFFFFASEGFIY